MTRADDFDSLSLAVKRERRKGKNFLLTQYGQSEIVREWVHRDDFMDFRYPK
jgi:hypothetical protein